MVPAELQVSDHTAVDKALDILHSAHVDYLLVRSEDGRCAGVVTQADLAPYSSQPWYSQQTRLRDLTRARGPFASPEMAATAAAVAIHESGLQAWPVVDADGYALGVLTAERLRPPSA
jgi:CBS-domain-containing membrane protein